MVRHVVEITWQDATSEGRWMGLHEAEEFDAALVRTVGYLVKETKDDVRLSMSANSVGMVGDVLIIPRGMVKKMVRIKRVTAP